MKNKNLKEKISFLISKVLIFIFCIIFISLYNKFFDSKNSTIGIALLTGLLMFLNNNLKIRNIEASLSIVFLFLISIISPHLAYYNLYLGIIINFISIFIILLISTNNIDEDNQLPFMLSYIFADGYNVTGSLFNKRLISTLIISIAIALIYYLIHKNKSSKEKISTLFRNININNDKTKWYLKLSITLTLVIFIGRLLNYPKTLWINFTILSLIRPSKEEYKKRVKVRLLATTLASIAFFIIISYLIPIDYKVLVSFIVGFIMMFIDDYHHKTMFNSFNALLTATIDLTNLTATILRIISNAIGVIIAIFIQNIHKFKFRKECSSN